MGKEKEDYIELHGIKIKGYGKGYTRGSIRFAQENLKHLGKLKCFICDYGDNYIIGENGKMVLTGIGFGVDVGGEGFGGFKEILKLIGIKKEDVIKGQQLIKEKPDDDLGHGRFVFIF